MKIIVSGGTGLIGSKFIQSRLNKNDEIFVLTRSKTAHQMPKTVRLLEWDAKTIGDWISEVNGADVVVNLAGENIGSRRWTQNQKNRIINSRVFSGQVLAEAIKQVDQKPGLFIQASAIGIYGTDKKKIIDETSALGEDFLASVGKLWENSVKELDTIEIRKIIVRFGVVLNREEGAFPKLVLPFKLFIGGPLGFGQQWVSWVHIDDITQALNFFIENPVSHGVYNITSPNPVRNAEFGKQIASELNRPYWLPVPGFMLRLVLGEMSTLVLDGQNVLPKKLLQEGFQFKYNLHTQAIKDLLV